VPAAVGVNEPDVTDPFPVTGFWLVKTAGPEQVVSPGPKAVKVIVPVGASPPDSTAVSVKDPPSAPPGDAVVARVGAVRRGVASTASAGSMQVVPVGLLLASPL
jgi:hypothetical protein